jgi:hypothetical protein
MGLFPPCCLIIDSDSFLNIGCRYVFSPVFCKSAVHLYTSLLFVEWIMVAIITGGLLLTFQGKKKD